MHKYSIEALREVTITVFAEDEEEAEEKARVGDVEEEDAGALGDIMSTTDISGECDRCGCPLEDEDSIATGKCYDCLVIDNEEEGEE